MLHRADSPPDRHGHAHQSLSLLTTVGGSTNPASLNRQELISRARFRCEHRHDGLTHHACFEKQNPSERIGFFDIEATSLNASFGFMLSYCIKRARGEVLKRTVSRSDILSRKFD